VFTARRGWRIAPHSPSARSPTRRSSRWPMPGSAATDASPHWRRRGWRATSNRGPMSSWTPCPDPRTESSTGARSPGLCERPWHDPARHHLRPDLPVVLYRLDQPRPRDGGAARPPLRDRVAPVPAQPRDARGRHGPPRIPGDEVRRQGGRGDGLRAGGGACRTRGPDAEPRPDRTHAQHDRRAPPDPLGRDRGAADPRGARAFPGLFRRGARYRRPRHLARDRRRRGPRRRDDRHASGGRRGCRRSARARRLGPVPGRDGRALFRRRAPARGQRRAAAGALDAGDRRVERAARAGGSGQ
jgi:hypothetical protein